MEVEAGREADWRICALWVACWCFWRAAGVRGTRIGRNRRRRRRVRSCVFLWPQLEDVHSNCRDDNEGRRPIYVMCVRWWLCL